MDVLRFVPRTGYAVYSQCEVCGVRGRLEEAGDTLAGAAVTAHAVIRRHRVEGVDTGDELLFPCRGARVAIVLEGHTRPPLWEAVLLPEGWAYCANGDRAARPRKGEVFEHPWTRLQERHLLAMDAHGKLPGVACGTGTVAAHETASRERQPAKEGK